jgi:ribose transport system substrate-binding protein
MQKLVIFTLMVLLLSSIALVSGQEQTTIGLSVPTLEQDFYLLLIDSARDAAEEADVELMVPETDALLDVEAELANVQTLLEAGIDSLIIYPVDSVASLGAVEAAAAADVPVILLDHDVLQAASAMESLSVVSVVARDTEAVGTTVADYICGELGEEGTVFTLLGAGLTGAEEVELDEIPAYQTVVDNTASIETALADTCSGITLVSEETETYTNMDSLTNFSSLLEDNRPDVVVVGDAELAISIIDAARAARLRGVMVIALEHSDEVLGALEGGQLTLAIISDPVALGSVGVTTAVAAANGEAVEAAITVDIVQVDSENAEQYRRPCNTGSC